MEIWLQQQWRGVSVWHLLLIPVSWCFALIVALRRYAYRLGLLKSYRLSVPVIVVGNLTVGGAGKTPVVVWLVQRLRELGFHPGVISRGYGRDSEQVLPVMADSQAASVGDEPLLLARRAACPVWVGAQRAATGAALLAAHPECDVLISDDGLQHYALQRDVEIVVVDGERKFGNGYLLPAGPLREPVRRLRAADLVLYNGLCNGAAHPGAYTMRLQGDQFVNLQQSQQCRSASDFVGVPLMAVAGIGNPERFFTHLRSLGLVFESRAFADHHAFVVADLAFESTGVVLMTEKDAVKCAAFAQSNWWYLPVQAEIEGDFLGQLLNQLRSRCG